MVVRASPDTLDADLAELEQELDDAVPDASSALSSPVSGGQTVPGKFNKKRKRKPDGSGERPGPHPRHAQEGQE